MPHIDELPDGADPVHLLIIGDSKTGKSTYTIEALIAGFTVIYCDSDNGLSAAKYVINSISDEKLRAEVKSRFHYFPIPKNPDDFARGFLRSTTAKPFRWIVNRGNEWNRLAIGVNPEDKVWEFDQTKINPNWILAKDSWSSISSAALGISGPHDEAALLDGTNQGIYGEANVNLTYICNMLQKVPYHVIVQAHATKYEEYEKPVGVQAGQVKQGQMTLKASTDVPWSSSRPHGQVMASRFNHIGWLSVNGSGTTDIDFMRKPNRIGGGPPNKKGPTKDLSFLRLTHGNVGDQTPIEGWFRETTHGELLELTDPKRKPAAA